MPYIGLLHILSYIRDTANSESVNALYRAFAHTLTVRGLIRDYNYRSEPMIVSMPYIGLLHTMLLVNGDNLEHVSMPYIGLLHSRKKL